MTGSDNLRYSLWIRWSEEDQLYIVEVPELPGCKTHGKTYVEAVIQAQDDLGQGKAPPEFSAAACQGSEDLIFCVE